MDSQRLTTHDDTRRAWLALLLLAPVPTIGMLCAMVLLPGTLIGQAIYGLAKVYLFAFPAAWWILIERRRISWSPVRQGGMLTGISLGLVISIVIVIAYVSLGTRIIDASTVRDAAESNGLDELPRFLALSIYLITVNSLLEEYAWRWFMFRQCEIVTNPRVAVVISALLFTIHHVIALKSQMGWTPTLLGSAGVFVGGAVWSWCYLRYRSIWPGYVSHAIVDVAVLGGGYHLIFIVRAARDFVQALPIIVADTMRTPPPSFFAMLDEVGIELAPSDIARLARFLEHLIETSESRFNLTAIREWEAAWQKHVLDSLTMVPILDALTEARIDETSDRSDPVSPFIAEATEDPPRVIDVGTGGGLPGIPLAIARPQMEVSLLEATAKKATFLDECVELLSLQNVTVLNDRAETVGRHASRHREHYDFALARALGPLHVSLELTVPLVRVGGYAVFIRGQRAGQDVQSAEKAAKLLRASHLDTVDTPTGKIVIYEKERESPKKYPRRPGEPKSNPLT